MKNQTFNDLAKEDIILMKLSAHDKDKLKSVYKDLMRKYHPDKNNSINAGNITQEIIDLYNDLLNKNIRYYDYSKEEEQDKVIKQNSDIKIDDEIYIKKIIKSKSLDYFKSNYLKFAKLKLSQFEYNKVSKNIKTIIDNIDKDIKKNDININDLKVNLNGIKFSDMFYSHICFEKAYVSLEDNSLINFTNYYVNAAINSPININSSGEEKVKESIKAVLDLRQKFTIYKKFKYIFFKMSDKEKIEIIELINKISHLNSNFIYQKLLFHYIERFII